MYLIKQEDVVEKNLKIFKHLFLVYLAKFLCIIKL